MALNASLLVLGLGASCRDAPPSPRGLVATPGACGASEAPPPEDPSCEEELARLVNATRAEHGLATLPVSADLAGAARIHARDMARDDYFEHDTFDRSGNHLRRECAWSERVDALAPGYARLGENLATGTIGPREVVDGWMGSPVHRETLLRPDWDAFGVGCWAGGDGGTYRVADFGGGSGEGSVVH